MKNSETHSGCSSKIGEDIIFQEILPRLPIKSIFRFKLVSKKWLNLITHDPLFHTHHSQKCPEKTNNITTFFSFRSKLFITEDDRFNWSEPAFMKRCSSEEVLIFGCVNGLIYGVYSTTKDIYICNPITKHTVFVPNPNKLMRIALAWNPHNPAFGFTIVGAGNDYYDQEYDWEGDNYQSPVPVRFVVYSSKTGEWRASKNDSEFLAPFGCHLWYPYVFTRGNKVCWCIGKHMLMFDIEEDNACLIPLPNNHNNITPFCFSSTNSSIDQLGDGELSYSRMANDGGVVVEIWLLREESNKFEWVNKYKVNLRTIIEENWNKSGYSHALGGRSCVQLLLYLDVEVALFQVTSWDCCRKVFLFNLTTRELKWIDDEISPGPLFTFVPTLIPCPT